MKSVSVIYVCGSARNVCLPPIIYMLNYFWRFDFGWSSRLSESELCCNFCIAIFQKSPLNIYYVVPFIIATSKGYAWSPTILTTYAIQTELVLSINLRHLFLYNPVTCIFSSMNRCAIWWNVKRIRWLNTTNIVKRSRKLITLPDRVQYV